ncbi:helix-turn-helix domain-containing protein [Ochrovirga pacifica]|uniref:helix-turn-helix domain-containing protein n=1 Tax=Ochrovirga pacifica TaxID=1042376 RepID=UPI0002557B74|nr:helix-turn-helix domain-containing protein [Ochrovirga pacifica]
MNSKVKEYDFRKNFMEFGFEIRKLEYFFQQHSEKEKTTPHKVNFYVLVFATNGQGKQLIDFTTYNYGKNKMLLVGKNQVHAWLEQDQIEGYILFFTQQFLYQNQIHFNDLSYEFPYNPYINTPTLEIKQNSDYELLKSLIEITYTMFIYNEDKTPNHEILQCMLRVILLKIRSLSKVNGQNFPKTQFELFVRFQQELDLNYASTRNASDYCKILKVSYKELNNTCKNLTQKTIKEFIDDYLILKAKRFLSHPTENVSTTSYQLGFDEVSNFSKFFKKHTKKTPKQFITEMNYN